MLLYHYTSAKALIGGKKVKAGQKLSVFPGGLRPNAKTQLDSTLSVDGMGWLTEQPDANVPYLPDPEAHCLRLTIEILDEAIESLLSDGNLCRWPEVRDHLGAPRLDPREDQWWLFRGTIPAAAFRALDKLPGRPFWLNDDPDAIVARDVSDAAAPAIPHRE